MSNQQMTQKVSEYLRDYDDGYETGYNDAKLDNLLLVRPEDKSPSWWQSILLVPTPTFERHATGDVYHMKRSGPRIPNPWVRSRRVLPLQVLQSLL